MSGRDFSKVPRPSRIEDELPQRAPLGTPSKLPDYRATKAAQTKAADAARRRRQKAQAGEHHVSDLERHLLGRNDSG